jgi:hypothetical protein
MDCVFNCGSGRPVAPDSSDDEPALLRRFQWFPDTSRPVRDRSDSRIGTPCRWQNHRNAAWRNGDWRSRNIQIGGTLGNPFRLPMDVLWRSCETTTSKRGFSLRLIRDGRLQAAPVASLMFTVVCGLVALRYGDGLWGWIATLFWTALFITVLPLVSFSRGKSDGARLWKLMRTPDTTMDGIAGTAGRRNSRRAARNWDPELIRQMLVRTLLRTSIRICNY